MRDTGVSAVAGVADGPGCSWKTEVPRIGLEIVKEREPSTVTGISVFLVCRAAPKY